jgi:hypothetical protein
MENGESGEFFLKVAESAGKEPFCGVVPISYL